MVERYFGVDGEMSGVDLAAGHRLIQIGVAVDTTAHHEPLPTPELFVSLIGWTEEELLWSEQAESVHGLSRETILAAPPAYEVDEALCEWLYEQGADSLARRNQIMVGFNVGVFDGPFLEAALPKFKLHFARRYGDLNPLCFVLASGEAHPRDGHLSSAGWKRRLKRVGLAYAAEAGRSEGEHDAGTDALQALGAWRHVEEHLRDLSAEATAWRRSERRRRLSQLEERS